MAEKTLIASLVSVICHAHTGYRRAGMAFSKGENTLKPDSITQTQLAQLKADPRLKVTVAEDALSSTTSNEPTGGNQSDGNLGNSTLPANLVTLAEKALSSSTLNETTGGNQSDGDLGDSTLPANLVEAIQRLDPSNTDHFTTSGKPATEALSELMQTKVSAAERDEAWETFQASEENLDGQSDDEEKGE
ncbi:HI1506-related protein [Vibrio parahaemolyticus]|uniref:HI1506-related protein n=1 Tax=Vibrio parahaemolyticus TaxID=670 RepID=UPI00215C363E|nr:HI1506-related protein [Vibrio parahaemolyticus]MCR9664501.1 HI1506-related protein [Vibrio parahaemolyticus]MCR9679584.1 HI1506-related protein [Vibrio parahaemolyticus]MDF5191497.1 HI1506-related protein [Vibrio parahaemolyticus]MDG2701251.1 HI1506-related protein [Vibrio parahaemolyticus]